jgi:hypothetical protein
MFTVQYTAKLKLEQLYDVAGRAGIHVTFHCEYSAQLTGFVQIIELCAYAPAVHAQKAKATAISIPTVAFVFICSPPQCWPSSKCFARASTDLDDCSEPCVTKGAHGPFQKPDQARAHLGFREIVGGKIASGEISFYIRASSRFLNQSASIYSSATQLCWRDHRRSHPKQLFSFQRKKQQEGNNRRNLNFRRPSQGTRIPACKWLLDSNLESCGCQQQIRIIILDHVNR